MEHLIAGGYVQSVSSGRVPVYKIIKEIKVFGKNLLFISGGGRDGSSEDFERLPKKGESYIPTHLSVTLDSMPEEEMIMVHREAFAPYKSNMQFLSKGSLDGSQIGVTVTCGHREF